MKQIVVFLFLFILLFSCRKKDVSEQAKTDDVIINQYISDHNLITGFTSSGLYYAIDSIGSGLQPSSGSSVTVAYKGYLTNETVFDESSSAGLTFSLSSVIPGWTEGIPLFKEGGSGKLLIPSALGYGDRETGGIPANSVLIFDIRLIEVL